MSELAGNLATEGHTKQVLRCCHMALYHRRKPLPCMSTYFDRARRRKTQFTMMAVRFSTLDRMYTVMSADGRRQPTPRCEVSSATYGWTLLRSSNGLQIPTLPKTLSSGSATVLRRKPNESAVKLGSRPCGWLRVPEGALGALVEVW